MNADGAVNRFMRLWVNGGTISSVKWISIQLKWH